MFTTLSLILAALLSTIGVTDESICYRGTDTLIPSTTLTPDEPSTSLASVVHNTDSQYNYIDSDSASWICGQLSQNEEGAQEEEENSNDESNLCMYLTVEDSCDCISTIKISINTDVTDTDSDSNGDPHILGALSYHDPRHHDIWFGISINGATNDAPNGGAFISPHCVEHNTYEPDEVVSFYQADDILELYQFNLGKDDAEYIFGTGDNEEEGEGAESMWGRITHDYDVPLFGDNERQDEKQDAKIYFELVNDKTRDTFRIGFKSENLDYWSYCTYHEGFYPHNDELLMSFLNYGNAGLSISEINIDYSCDSGDNQQDYDDVDVDSDSKEVESVPIGTPDSIIPGSDITGTSSSDDSDDTEEEVVSDPLSIDDVSDVFVINTAFIIACSVIGGVILLLLFTWMTCVCKSQKARTREAIAGTIINL